jgi:hypothetical protein
MLIKRKIRNSLIYTEIMLIVISLIVAWTGDLNIWSIEAIIYFSTIIAIGVVGALLILLVIKLISRNSLQPYSDNIKSEKIETRADTFNIVFNLSTDDIITAAEYIHDNFPQNGFKRKIIRRIFMGGYSVSLLVGLFLIMVYNKDQSIFAIGVIVSIVAVLQIFLILFFNMKFRFLLRKRVLKLYADGKYNSIGKHDLAINSDGNN